MQPASTANVPVSAILLSVAALLAGCGEKAAPPKAPPPEVGVVTIQPRTLPLVSEQAGQTAGFREVEVRARVSGILVKRLYTEGQQVKEGQVLFQIDPDPFRAALDQARGSLRQQQASLERATQDRDRIVPLFKENAVSRKDFDDANSNFEGATASVAIARANVTQAEINLGYTNVTAPISGFASKENKSEGSLVSNSPGDAGLLTTISQLDPMYVNFAFAETEKLEYDQNIRTGRVVAPKDLRVPVRVKLADGTIYDTPGLLDFADAKVDPKTGTIRARAEFPNKKGTLLPGQFVRVLAAMGEIQNAFAVPERAITQAQATRLVLVVNAQNKVEPHPVVLGPRVGDEIVIVSGVKAGDRVIVDGLMKARPGSEVKPVAAGAKPPGPQAPTGAPSLTGPAKSEAAKK
ncbi:efflux RND transporter periplasmic adaptor subunit [Usitatibacter palustris]|uniref:Multidrug resistance protein MdtE n=1 Tax=Usitatibacter palustris TaxID=2732487 RepID=A0A6M4H8P3_9PROT|nr:efflux RND transporter periplasmic adaptor subunit [Usitatibacter palustris]QJR15941.1 Multidrug resistance protein MdtE [Usitatibacter palustris]